MPNKNRRIAQKNALKESITRHVNRQVVLSWVGSAPLENHERIKRAAASAKTQLDEFIDALFEDIPPAKVIRFIKKLEDWRGDARLYADDNGTNLVVSAVVEPFGGSLETFIFQADTEGEVSSFLELPGSFRGALDHHKALRNHGYDVIIEDIAA